MTSDNENPASQTAAGVPVVGGLLDALMRILPFGLPPGELLSVLVRQGVEQEAAAKAIRRGLENGSIVLDDRMNIVGEHPW